jgi:hypothetical protein
MKISEVIEETKLFLMSREELYVSSENPTGPFYSFASLLPPSIPQAGSDND